MSKPRGFAALSPEQRREIATKGSHAVAPDNRSFSQPGFAAKAGGKGGRATPAAKRAFSVNRELAAEAGRKGGLARRRKQADG